MRARLTLVSPLAVCLVYATWLVNIAVAQSPVVHSAQTPDAPVTDTKTKGSNGAEKSSRGWRVSPAFRIDAEYDDNVFLLAASRKDNVAAPSGAEVISGRYSDMKSANDVLTTLSAGVALKGPGLMGKSSLVTPELSYELYAQNTARSNLILGLSLQQEMWAESRLRLQGRLTPSYFARNYMADAVDQDASGTITEDERVYATGEYREGELGADYRLRIAKRPRKDAYGVSLQIGGGFYSRSYDAPLSGRNLHGPTAGAKLLLELGRRVELDVGYDYASLGTTPTGQVLLLDEPDFGQDFNGNGNQSDLDARVLTTVDRSRREHSLGASLRFEPSKKADITLGYEHRWRRYTSTEPLDVANRGRRDARHQLSADIRLRLTKDLRLRLGGVHSTQDLNRTGDPGSAGEIDDYTRSQGRLGLSYEL
jgi:hypothetical protein